MRILSLLISAMLLMYSVASAQSCCSAPAQGMAMFASQKSFQKAHRAPRPYHYEGMQGDFVSFETSDGTKGRAFLLKAKKATDKYLFVYHEWWGLNDYIQKEVETYYKDFDGAVNVMAIDLYDGKVAATPEDAGKLMQSIQEARAKAIIAGALKFVGEKARIASVGWCFGGGWSLKSALLEGKQAAGCVVYYGMPVENEAELATLNCDVLGIFANNDKWITMDVVSQFAQKMAHAGKNLALEHYDADHAFANPSNPKHDKVKAQQAHAHAVAYLKKSLL